jgi:hypothetical protein
MNYAGHEKLRAEVAGLANNMCDLRATLNNMEHRYRFDSDVAGRTPDPPDAFSHQCPVYGGVQRHS